MAKGFPDGVYALAAGVFQAAQEETTLGHGVIRYDPGKMDRSDPGSKQEELWAYELAFNALKFQELLEDVLIDSCFHGSRQTSDDPTALAPVMLYDLQQRKFQPREPNRDDPAVEEVREVEESLLRFRTKLAAALARRRIKRNLTSIDDVLPETVRAKHRRKPELPVCAWVNTLKSSVDEACAALGKAGLVATETQGDLDGSAFCKDAHGPDVLLFPQTARERLDRTGLLSRRTLVVQGKSRCLAACALRPLLVPNFDVLLAGSFSALTAAHVAVQASARSSGVVVCGVSPDPGRREELQSTFSSVGCTNVQLLPEGFGKLNEADPRLQKVRAVLLLPRCTASGLCDPTAHIIHEDGDRGLLRDLSQGTVSFHRLDSLIRQQMQDLTHALSFPRVQSVVYCTCSVYAEENEQVIKRALRNIAAVRPKARPFRVVSTGWKDDREKFFRLQESNTTDACFLCVLKREDSESESAQDVLVRAAAKGLLAGLIIHEKTTQVKKSPKPRGSSAAPPLPPAAPSHPDHRRDPEEALHTRAEGSGDATILSTDANQRAQGQGRKARRRKAPGQTGKRHGRGSRAPHKKGLGHPKKKGDVGTRTGMLWGEAKHVTGL